MAVRVSFVQFEGLLTYPTSGRLRHTFGRKTVTTRNELDNGRMDPDLEKHAATAVILWSVLLLVATLML